LGGYIGILQMEGDVFLKHTSQGSTEKRGVGLSDTQIDAKIDKRNQADNTNGVCLLLRVGLDRVYLWLHHRLYCVF
jgi:hypothetical protein